MAIEKSKIKRRGCFFDIHIDSEPIGRIIMELFDDLVPITTENFLMLCTGQAGIGKVTSKPLHYKGSMFHRVIKNFMVQGGDFTAGNGTGGESIYGGVFEDEAFVAKHDQPFLLSMANRGKDTNGSQFFITTKAAPHLDDIHVVFGKVISGQEVVTKIENLKVNTKSRPLADVVIANCGQLVQKETANEQSEKELKESATKKKHKKEAKKATKERDDDGEKITSEKTNDLEIKNEPENISSVKAEDLPEVPVTNKYLMRRSKTPEGGQNSGRQQRKISGGGGSMITRSGHRVKGRGAIRFRTPPSDEDERPGRRSRSTTPPHWKREERRLITLKKFDERIKRKLEIEEKEREAAKRQAVSATNEIQTFGYRQPVFPQMPSKDDINRDEQKQRERSPLKSRHHHVSSKRDLSDDMHHHDRDRTDRGRGRDNRENHQREHSRGERDHYRHSSSLRNGHQYNQSKEHSSSRHRVTEEQPSGQGRDRTKERSDRHYREKDQHSRSPRNRKRRSGSTDAH